jgi:hypothetical protein
MIAEDLPYRFPEARIVRRVQLVEGRYESSLGARRTASDNTSAGNLVDFLILSHGGPKLIFESCIESESRQSSEKGGNKVQYAILNDESGSHHVDVTRAEKFQACLKIETGEVSYRRMAN